MTIETNDDAAHAEFIYTPDEDTRIHKEGAIKLICAAFQSHEVGLPEWLKNGADEYARSNVPESNRVIVVMFDKGSASRSSSIAVLDFNGMTSLVIEEDFRVWADPEASIRGASSFAVEGGHGNGGKCYMTMMFNEHSLVHTVRAGLGNRYGVSAGTVQFGYIPDREDGRDFDVSDVESELDAVLAAIGADVESLPEAAKSALSARQGFSIFIGRDPKGYGRRLPVNSLVSSIVDHPQMVRTLDFCDIYVMSNGTILEEANPLELEPIEPDPIFFEPRVIEIPSDLVDPQTAERVSTTDSGQMGTGELTLRTSDKNMRYSRRKNRHNMTYHATSGFIGHSPMIELGVRSTYVSRIYGECHLDALEAAKQNVRGQLANSPLSRAVISFVAKKVEELTLEFEVRERRTYDQREKDALSLLNEALDQWKNRFMSDYLHSFGGGVGGGTAPDAPIPLPTGTPIRIEVTMTHSRAGIGISFKPLVRFFDRDERRIRPVPYQWVSEDTNIAWVDPDLNIVNTFARGDTKIWAQSLDSGLESNKVDLEVVKIRSIHLLPESIELEASSKSRVQAMCTLSSGDVVSNVALIWTEGNPVVARVSASGMVFGGSPGETDVTAGDNSCMADDSVTITVTEASRGDGDTGGRSYPKILLSGVDDDPETGDEVTLSTDDPPVLQRPQDVDRNVWWINSSAPLARMYLDADQGYGYPSREWRMYHVERYIEIIAQIAITSNPDLDLLEPAMWVIMWGERVAAVQAAAAESLAEFIKAGDAPVAV